MGTPLGGWKVHEHIDITVEVGVLSFSMYPNRFFDPGDAYPGELESVGKMPILNVAL